MHLRSFVACLILGIGLFGTAFVQTAHAQRYDFPPRPSQPVLDQADLLSGAQEQRLVRKLTAFEDTTSTAVVVVTLSSLNGAPISDYAFALGREWGVGQKDKDNGVVVLVSKGDRKVFIATGYGVEGALPDAVANRIVDRVITPAFRQGQFYAGLDQGTDAIIQATKGEYTADSEAASSTDRMPTALGFILIILIYFIGSSFSRRGRGGKRKSSRRRRGDMPIFIWGGGGSRGGGFSGGGGGFGGFGGGSFGGGGAGGSW